jgi:hypothetical protein
MYQRVAQGEIALFDASSVAVLEPPALPEPAILSTKPARRIVVVSAPGNGPSGERTFILEKDVPNIVKDAEMSDAGVDDAAQIQEKEKGLEDARDQAADDYVWDVMVRTTVKPSPGAQSTLLDGPSVFGPNSGRLLLDLNDNDNRQLFNELYQSDEDDEDRVETDDEDENAEDYYGADYPDEEDDEGEDEGDEFGDDYYGSDDDGSGGGGAGYYNESTGRFSKAAYLDTYDDEVRSVMR